MFKEAPKRSIYKIKSLRELTSRDVDVIQLKCIIVSIKGIRSLQLINFDNETIRQCQRMSMNSDIEQSKLD